MEKRYDENSGLTVSIKFDNFVVGLKIENYEIGYGLSVGCINYYPFPH